MSQRMEQEKARRSDLPGVRGIGPRRHERLVKAALCGLGLLLAAGSFSAAIGQGTDGGVSAATKKLLASPLDPAPPSPASVGHKARSKAAHGTKTTKPSGETGTVSRHEAAAGAAGSEAVDSNWRAKWIARWKVQHAGKLHAKAISEKAGAKSARSKSSHMAVKSEHPTHKVAKAEPVAHTVAKAEHSARKHAAAKHAEPVIRHSAATRHPDSTASSATLAPVGAATKRAHRTKAAAAALTAKSAPAPSAAANAGTKPAPAVSAAAGAINPDVLSKTRPDAFSASSANKPMDSPMSAVGDGWKLILYLIPMLLVTVGAMRVLRGFYERNGKLPVGKSAFPGSGGWGTTPASRPGGSLLNALMGSFHLNNARARGGSSIRLVESVPVGNANLHLIEVRGRVLLIGATGAGVSLLTELEHEAYMENGDFRALLQAAASDLDTLDAPMGDLPAEALVGTLEEDMRDTSDALRRRARRLRTVQEEEDECA